MPLYNQNSATFTWKLNGFFPPKPYRAKMCFLSAWVNFPCKLIWHLLCLEPVILQQDSHHLQQDAASWYSSDWNTRQGKHKPFLHEKASSKFACLVCSCCANWISSSASRGPRAVWVSTSLICLQLSHDFAETPVSVRHSKVRPAVEKPHSPRTFIIQQPRKF